MQKTGHSCSPLLEKAQLFPLSQQRSQLPAKKVKPAVNLAVIEERLKTTRKPRYEYITPEIIVYKLLNHWNNWLRGHQQILHDVQLLCKPWDKKLPASIFLFFYYYFFFNFIVVVFYPDSTWLYIS